jgi:hypothetical protein
VTLAVVVGFFVGGVGLGAASAFVVEGSVVPVALVFSTLRRLIRWG